MLGNMNILLSQKCKEKRYTRGAAREKVVDSLLYIRLYIILVKHSKRLTKARAGEIMLQKKTGVIKWDENKTL